MAWRMIFRQKWRRTARALNQHLAAYESLLKIHIHDKEFEKTPKRSIKRFLYNLDEIPDKGGSE